MLMQVDEVIFVAYFDEATGQGYKASTVAQVASAINKVRLDVHLMVRRDKTRDGAFIHCLALVDDEEEVDEDAVAEEEEEEVAGCGDEEEDLVD